MIFNVISAKYMFSPEDTYNKYKHVFDMFDTEIIKDKYENDILVVDLNTLDDLITFTKNLNKKNFVPLYY